MKVNSSKEWCKKSAELEKDCPGGIMACSPQIYAEMIEANDKFNQLSLTEKIRYLKAKMEKDKVDNEKFANNKILCNNLRKKCNTLTKSERKKYYKRGIKLINNSKGPVK